MCARIRLKSFRSALVFLTVFVSVFGTGLTKAGEISGQVIYRAPLVVNKTIYHGAVADTDAPLSYGLLDGSLVFSAADRLYRLDEIVDATVLTPLEIALPPDLGHGLTLSARFASFDGALFFHAVRANSGKSGTFVNRLDSVDALPVLVDVEEEPDTPEWATVPRGYPDDTVSFAEYDGKLYFFSNRWYMPTPFPHLRLQLFRLDDAVDTTPQAIFLDWPQAASIVEPAVLFGTDSGLVMRTYFYLDPRFADRRDNLLETMLMAEPNTVLPASPDWVDYTLISEALPRSGGSTLNVAAWFDGMLFYRGANNIGFSDHFPDIGPFSEPGSQSQFYGFYDSPYEIELYRFNPATGDKVYFDLHPMTEAAAAAARPDYDRSSSQPGHVVVAGYQFYFQALPDGVNAELFRMTSATALPERIVLNTAAPSRGTPLADMGGRLLFGADIGRGYDLHYFDDDGVTPISLNIGKTVATTARGFKTFKDHLVFSARDDNSDWWTYSVRFRDKPDVVLTAEVTVNGKPYPNTPGIELPRGTRINVRCAIKNHGDESLSDLRISIRDHRNTAQSGGKPRRLGRATGKKRAPACRYKKIDGEQTRGCRLSTHVTRGTHKYICEASAREKTTHSKKRRVRVKGVAYVTAIGKKPKRPKKPSGLKRS